MLIATATAPDTGWRAAPPEYAGIPSDQKRVKTDLGSAARYDAERVRERTAELVATQEKALQTERLAAIGQTVAALAHEGRNALQRIAACLSCLEMRQEGRPDELALTRRAQQALGDLERLFDDVRTHAAPVSLRRTACDLGPVWRESWAQAVARNAQRDARLEEEGTAPACEADPFRMGQVFLNLFANALEACPGPVRVTVACREVELGGRPALRVAVRDNGPGFPEEQRRHLFEPFCTTKPRGTGLGMAITRRIVEAHGGEIAVGDGPGAEVVITLPGRQAGVGAT
jgi:signal transduction histidine kinase